MDASTYFQLLQQRLAKSGSTSVVRIRGMCMSPGVLSGMRLRLRALGPDEPRPGRVYVFRVADVLFAHRCLGRDAAGFLFRGDHSLSGETVTDRAEVLGRVEAAFLGPLPLRLEAWEGRLFATLAGPLVDLGRRLPEPWRSLARSALRRLAGALD